MKIRHLFSSTLGLSVLGILAVLKAAAQDQPPIAPAKTLPVPAQLSDMATGQGALQLEPALPAAPGLNEVPRQSLVVPRAALQTNQALRLPTGPANAAAQALRSQLQASLGAGMDTEALRQALLKNANAPEARGMLEAIRAASRPLLEAERTRAGGGIAANSASTATTGATDFDKVIPRKIALDPLPPLTAQTNAASCEKLSRIEELRAAVAAATDPEERDPLRLELAGFLGGQNDWLAAKTIYDDLLATSSVPGVVEAARRNLLVVDKKLQALAAPDQAQREQLELELAAIHYDLGHEPAARRLTRALAQSAQTPQVRADAAILLQANPQATQPVILPAGLVPSSQEPPNSAK
jgi:hypothetical protein